MNNVIFVTMICSVMYFMFSTAVLNVTNEDFFSSPLHLMQYHSRIAFADFSVMLMQWPWNHSLQLSQPLSVGE